MTTSQQSDTVREIVDSYRSASRDTVGINVALEDEGVGVRVKRAGGWNTAYSVQLALNAAPFRMALRAEALTDETARRIMAKTYAESIIMRWWPLPGKDVELPPCKAEAIEDWLMSHPDALRQLIEVAETEEYFLGDGDPGRVHATDR